MAKEGYVAVYVGKEIKKLKKIADTFFCDPGKIVRTLLAPHLGLPFDAKLLQRVKEYIKKTSEKKEKENA